MFPQTCSGPAALAPEALPLATVPEAVTPVPAAVTPAADVPAADATTLLAADEATAPEPSTDNSLGGGADTPSATAPSRSDTTPRSATQDPSVSEGQSELEDNEDKPETERNIWYLYFAAIFATSALIVACCLCSFFYCNRDSKQRRLLHVNSSNDAAGTDTADATVVTRKSASNRLARQ